MNKSSGATSNTDNGDFYGVNAVLSATNGAKVTIKNATADISISNAELTADNSEATVESGCTWDLTGDCTISSFTNNGTINYNGYTITLAEGTVLK